MSMGRRRKSERRDAAESLVGDASAGCYASLLLASRVERRVRGGPTFDVIGSFIDRSDANWAKLSRAVARVSTSKITFPQLTRVPPRRFSQSTRDCTSAR
jgi:hypothetical protein